MMIVDEQGNIFTKDLEFMKTSYCFLIKFLDLVLEYSSETDEDGKTEWVLVYDDEMRKQLESVRRRLT